MDLTLNLEKGDLLGNVIPDGDYLAIVSNWEAKKFSTGSIGASVEFTITEDEYSGRKQWSNLVMQENSIWKITEFLKAMELWTDDELLDNSNLGDLLEQARGESLTIRVGHHEWEGEMRNNVGKFLPA